MRHKNDRNVHTVVVSATRLHRSNVCRADPGLLTGLLQGAGVKRAKWVLRGPTGLHNPLTLASTASTATKLFRCNEMMQATATSPRPPARRRIYPVVFPPSWRACLPPLAAVFGQPRPTGKFELGGRKGFDRTREATL